MPKRTAPQPPSKRRKTEESETETTAQRAIRLQKDPTVIAEWEETCQAHAAGALQTAMTQGHGKQSDQKVAAPEEKSAPAPTKQTPPQPRGIKKSLKIATSMTHGHLHLI